jgi:Ca-activated chloride channel family protein
MIAPRSWFNGSKTHVLGRNLGKGMLLGMFAVLLGVVACAHSAQSNAPQAERASEGGTGTRAKSEIDRSQPLRYEHPKREAEAKSDSEPADPLADRLTAPLATPPASAPSLPLEASGAGLAGVGAQAGNLRQSQGSMAWGSGGMGRAQAHAKKSSTGAPLQLLPRPLPKPDFNTESYDHVTENRFLKVTEQPLSTFSIDVDTASYSNARRFITQGTLPPKDAIRVEEWVNYFGYDYSPPDDDRPFAVNAEVASCPWDADHRLVRIGLKGKVISEANVPPRNLVFLIDVSGSMMDSNKLPLVKHGLGMLVERLRPQDSIAMVVYAGASGLVLPATKGSERGKILTALDQLEAGGSTNGADGIRLAYDVAGRAFHSEGINRVILATDGDFNVGTTSEGELQRLIEDKRKSGIFLTVLGFGMGNIKDSTLEMLADKGNGSYAYVDSANEAQKVLVREAGSTLVTIAKDVKLQVEFNPKHVASYKLIGYENRMLAKEDFNDDKKDAGEIGAGHSVTALYEVVPTGAPSPSIPAVDPLKYQAPGTLSPAAQTPELLTVNVRYKPVSSETSTRFSVVVGDDAKPIEQTSNDYRFSVAVANVALLLRGSADVKKSSLQTARALAEGALGADRYGDRREFLALVDRATALGRAQ